MVRLAWIAGLLVGVGLAVLLAGAGQAQDDRPRRVVNVTLQDQGCPSGPDRFCAIPGEVTLEDGADLVLRVKNEGRIEHNLTFGEEVSDRLAKHGTNGTLSANETRRLHIPWPAIQAELEESGQANVTMQCARDGHAALGERLVIHVPSLAASGERPQPGLGAALAVAVVGAVALSRKRG